MSSWGALTQQAWRSSEQKETPRKTRPAAWGHSEETAVPEPRREAS